MPAMKATGFDEALHGYLAAHRTPDDQLLGKLRRETQERFSDQANMLISPEQGTFLRILVSALGASRVVEVGTFTGYSSISMARGLPEGGRLLALDVSEEYTALARKYWKRAGLADRIELKLGPAMDSLRALPRQELFDFAFIDADKPSYWGYFEEILARLRPGGLVAVDNVLWDGTVIQSEDTSESTVAIREFNDRIVADDRVESVMIAIADGLNLIHKL
jgi:caffeoyl-CoA O-methyltransferase